MKMKTAIDRYMKTGLIVIRNVIIRINYDYVNV